MNKLLKPSMMIIHNSTRKQSLKLLTSFINTFNSSLIPNIYKFSKIRPFSTIKSHQNDQIPIPNPSTTPIDAGSSIRKPLSLWPGVYHSPVTNALWEARSNIFDKGVGNVTVSENGLVSKNPSNSRTSVEYKFSEDYVLREQYRNPWNEIRMGKLVEDLDALAGTISYKLFAQWRN